MERERGGRGRERERREGGDVSSNSSKYEDGKIIEKTKQDD